MTSRSDTSWFDPKWLGQTIHFDNPSSSWKIIEKLQEHESRFCQDEYVSSGLYSECSCIFVCEDTSEGSRAAQAIMKVRMQIPNSEDERPDSCQKFSQPPEKEICGRTALEIKALKALSIAGCSCTPKYIASKHVNRQPDGWVPEGFLDCIVMERVEGRTLSREYFRDLRPEEKQKIRTKDHGLNQWTFFNECQGFGFENLDNNITNLIWNEKKMKCYIVDWEAWSRKIYRWKDNEYRWWSLHD